MARPSCVAAIALPLVLASASLAAQPAGNGSPDAQPPDAGLASAVPEPIEVTVRAKRSDAQQLQESAEAVTVVDTRKAQQQTADLGEVLARSQGIGLRREGGLGSNSTISLNGLQGDQVRVFVDGVPLELAGYPFDAANVPVNLIERIEIYRGVVPIRFGADALGGAINLVTNQRYQTGLGASYQLGSFGTVRATLNGRYRHEPTGLVFGVTGFLDSTRNDYWMDDRPLPTPTGRTILKSVRRFHDAYRAAGGNVEVGVVERPWARRFLLQVFASSYAKELQHNYLMTTPYGEITYGESVAGTTARYEVSPARGTSLELLANYSHRRSDFEDLSSTIYDWEGRRGVAVGRNGARGELRGEAIDRSLYEDTFYGRAGLAVTVLPGHTLRVSTTPKSVARIGDDHVEARPDLLRLEQRSFQLVSGVEYQLDLLGDDLSNVLFGKDYHLTASAEDRSPVTAEILERSYAAHRIGMGDALRYRFTPWFLGKVSYEYATRLPNADELFGDGRLIRASADQYNEQLLQPEKSHNLNVGPRFDVRDERYGKLIVDLNGFLRESADMIVLLAGRQSVPYSNLANARTLGVDAALSWASPGRWLNLEGSFTWQDVRNTSMSGPFEPQRGMRIPSRPYLFGSWGARLRFAGLPDADDALEPFYSGRYVHGFARGWDVGLADFKMSVAPQLSHNAGVTWLLGTPYGRLTSTFEIENLSDAKLYDVFGTQRAGRAAYLKLTGQI